MIRHTTLDQVQTALSDYVGSEVKLPSANGTKPPAVKGVPLLTPEEWLATSVPETKPSKYTVELSRVWSQTVEVAKAREALYRLDIKRTLDYHQWLYVGMSLWELGDQGLELWEEYSKRCSDKYEPGVCAEKWSGFGKERDTRYTLGSLYHWAEEDTGWTQRDFTPPLLDTAQLITAVEPEPITASTDTWQIRTMSDARKPRDPVVYAVDGIVRASSLNVFYGAPGSLKSLLFMDMCMCVALGIPWLAPFADQLDISIATTQMPVLWVDFDNGSDLTMERVQAIGDAYNAPDDVPFYFYSMPSPWLDAGDPRAMDALAERILRLQVGMVVTDTLSTVKGRASENTDEMTPVMSNFRMITERTKAGMSLIHHQRKANGEGGRSGESLRGFGGIEAALDLALLCEREENSNVISMKSTKVRGADVSPFSAMFVFKHHEGTKTLRTARFHGTTRDTTEKNFEAVEKAVYSTAKSHPGKDQGSLAVMVKLALPKIGVNQIRAVMDDMVAKNRLEIEEGAHGAKLYHAK